MGMLEDNSNKMMFTIGAIVLGVLLVGGATKYYPEIQSFADEKIEMMNGTDVWDGNPTDSGDDVESSMGFDYQILNSTAKTIAATGYSGSGTDVTIPNNVDVNGTKYTIVELEPGSWPTDMTSLTMPDTITTITDAWMFSWRTNLKKVTLSNSLTAIPNGTFSGDALTSITIPDSVKTIGQDAFEHNSISSLTIPTSVTDLQAQSFADNKLSSVKVPSSLKSEINSYSSYDNPFGSNPSSVSTATVNYY